jgi:hypothetical protein
MTILLKTIDFFCALALSVVAAGLICLAILELFVRFSVDEVKWMLDSVSGIVMIFGLAFVSTFALTMWLYWRRLTC